MNTPTDPIPPTNNCATSLIADFNKGRANRELNESFAQVVQSVRKHGKAGEVILKIKVSPARGSDARQSTITLEVTKKTPATAPHSAFYYTREDGGVQKDDPEQDELPFTPVALPSAAPEPAPIVLPESSTATN